PRHVRLPRRPVLAGEPAGPGGCPPPGRAELPRVHGERDEPVGRGPSAAAGHRGRPGAPGLPKGGDGEDLGHPRPVQTAGAVHSPLAARPVRGGAPRPRVVPGPPGVAGPGQPVGPGGGVHGGGDVAAAVDGPGPHRITSSRKNHGNTSDAAYDSASTKTSGRTTSATPVRCRTSFILYFTGTKNGCRQ